MQNLIFQSYAKTDTLSLTLLSSDEKMSLNDSPHTADIICS